MTSPNLRHRNNRDFYSAQVIALYLSGKTIRQCSDELSISYDFAHSTVQKAGIMRNNGEGSRARHAENRLQYMDAVKQLHSEGLTIGAICKRLSTGITIVKSCLSDMGLTPNKQTGVHTTINNFRQRERYHFPTKTLYDGGLSVNSIAETLGITRHLVVAIFNDLSIPVPSISEGNRRSANFLTPDERQKRAEAAHQAIAARGRNEFTQQMHATKKQASMSYVGFGELELIERLRDTGIECIPQFAWHGYNIDIMCGSLAVEVHNAVDHPFKQTRYIRKTMQLMCSGRNVAFIWLNRNGREITERAFNELIAFHDFTSRNPTALGQYRMIRGNGKIVPNADRYLNDLTDVISLYHTMKTSD